MAHQAGVTVAAVTDHDTVSGIVAACSGGGLRNDIFPGIEISVQGGKELHILDMAFIPTHVLHQFCAKHAADRTDAAAKCLPTSRKRRSHYAGRRAPLQPGKTSGRPHFAERW
ncbi:MAG: hypothetical protein ACLUOF_08140 [Ruminococcus sp.]